METMIARVAAMHELLRSSHEAGIEPWGSMYTQGHGQHWSGVYQYLMAHRVVLGAAV